MLYIIVSASLNAHNYKFWAFIALFYIYYDVQNCLLGCTSETSVDNYFTRQYIPEDNSEHHTRRRENLKSHLPLLIWILNCSSAWWRAFVDTLMNISVSVSQNFSTTCYLYQDLSSPESTTKGQVLFLTCALRDSSLHDFPFPSSRCWLNLWFNPHTKWMSVRVVIRCYRARHLGHVMRLDPLSTSPTPPPVL
jgi:hypothetical protein